MHLFRPATTRNCISCFRYTLRINIDDNPSVIAYIVFLKCLRNTYFPIYSQSRWSLFSPFFFLFSFVFSFCIVPGNFHYYQLSLYTAVIFFFFFIIVILKRKKKEPRFLILCIFTLLFVKSTSPSKYCVSAINCLKYHWRHHC